MTDTDLLNKNLHILQQRFPYIYENILRAKTGSDYGAVEKAKTGTALPVLKNGMSLHSRYNPEREAEKMFSGRENFVLFCGLGCGIHVSVFLHTFTEKKCACTEAGYPALKNLLGKTDFSALFSNPNFTLLPPPSDGGFTNTLLQTYIPALHGNFEVKTLRAWEEFYKTETETVKTKVRTALETIKADVSTQAHFGKIWMRNLLINLKTASKIRPVLPPYGTKKTALVLGAGPGLEKSLKTIKENRNAYAVFSSDTAFPVLNSHGITADFFVGMDPQAVSCEHSFPPFSKKTAAVFDLCAHPSAVAPFIRNGNRIIFTKSAHPFALYAASFSPFPYMETGSGTVALAAKSAALSLGFKNIEFSGLDFAYVNGKAYANGTYLSRAFSAAAQKTAPSETLFANLMFRTPVETITENGAITYTTPLLKSYKTSFEQDRTVPPLWKPEDFAAFPYSEFLLKLKKDAKQNNPALKTAFLPYLTYRSKKSAENTVNLLNLELVLFDILGYTVA